MNVAEATQSTSTYNGWSNRETWLVNLWIDGDQKTYEYVQEAYREQGDVHARAEWLENEVHKWLDSSLRDANASLWSDLLTNALNRVNWLEIVEAR